MYKSGGLAPLSLLCTLLVLLSSPLLSSLVTATSRPYFGPCCKSYDGHCKDGTTPTPCCAFDHCDMFCCDCNRPCRPGPVFDADFPINWNGRGGPDPNKKPPPDAVHKDSLPWKRRQQRQQQQQDEEEQSQEEKRSEQTPHTTASKFELVNVAGDGMLTLAEYLAWADAVDLNMSRQAWVSYFNKFDRDGKGYVLVNETKVQE